MSSSSSSPTYTTLTTDSAVEEFVNSVDYILVDCDGVCYLGNKVSCIDCVEDDQQLNIIHTGSGGSTRNN